ncbi:EAL domain-containing protein [Cereibacter azotoformans]|uniref:Diguanylate cyclase/phosphodiesterase with PAS/PAC sensor(S) n=1 Tax=Cereibacter azotoformans TaxID=43057 RepID=A0A2T5K5V0_9RHOB|nr:GGDEF and EAL domain-containing protein [Cereibacter azotoformans]AXQ95543.1 EAL domain-containing protein [Cereibacter sphaeroides]PTR17728.1 diguanylate cyclase/phosphodiesterase with PAS/PAC sensor(s) [Cereibacter azotoformans]UIJ32211.1 EAL domain-containing protein [Cereibacter azotoformans]
MQIRMPSMKFMTALTRRAPEFVAAVYAVLSALWILFSDRTVALLAENPAAHHAVQTYKGLGFITASSLVLYLVLRSAWSELSASNARLTEAERRLADVIRGGEVGTWQFDLGTGIILINDRWAELIGYSRSEIEPVTIEFWNRIVHPEDLARMREKHLRQFAEGNHVLANEIRLRHRQGHWVWIMSRGRVTGFSADGTPVLMSGVHMDISRRKALEDELQVERNLLRRVMETSVSAVLAFDGTNRVIFANREAEAVLGAPAEQLVGRTVDDPGWGISDGDGSELPLGRYPVVRAATENKVLRGLRLDVLHPQKGARVLSVNVAPVEQGDSRVRVVAAFTDVTEQIEAERTLAAAAEDALYQALHDPMTRLPNRVLFRECLEAAVRHGGRLALIFIDLDNFKQINDRFGHFVGDRVILDVGRKLGAAVPPDSTVARIGGDEFTVLVPLAADDSIEDRVASLVREIEQPVTVEGNIFYLTASFGVSLFPDDATDADTMVRNADLAMYAAKAKGRNQCVRFDAALREQSSQLGILGQGLQRAIRQRHLELYLQPKVALSEGRPIVGAEALLRWNDPELGSISPARFIPVAESCGLIRSLDQHVTDLLCELLERWGDKGIHLPVFVNISAETLASEGFADGFLGKLERLAIPPARVGIEITEGSLLETSHVTRSNVGRLTSAGIPLSVDDFGTGYSSLGYLHRLALSELKIDRSFVAQIGTGRDGAEAIVRAVLAFGRALGLRTVAEGVETGFQCDWLIREGCDQAQGFLFAPPVPVAEFERLVAGWRREVSPPAPAHLN